MTQEVPQSVLYWTAVVGRLLHAIEQLRRDPDVDHGAIMQIILTLPAQIQRRFVTELRVGRPETISPRQRFHLPDGTLLQLNLRIAKRTTVPPRSLDNNMRFITADNLAEYLEGAATAICAVARLRLNGELSRRTKRHLDQRGLRAVTEEDEELRSAMRRFVAHEARKARRHSRSDSRRVGVPAWQPSPTLQRQTFMELARAARDLFDRGMHADEVRRFVGEDLIRIRICDAQKTVDSRRSAVIEAIDDRHREDTRVEMLISLLAQRGENISVDHLKRLWTAAGPAAKRLTDAVSARAWPSCDVLRPRSGAR